MSGVGLGFFEDFKSLVLAFFSDEWSEFPPELVLIEIESVVEAQPKT